jgi:LCP family protein required for cell wall assembly
MKLYGGSGGSRREKEGRGFISSETDTSSENGPAQPSGDMDAAERIKSPEEQKEIEALIADYRKYKRKKRIAAMTICLTLAVCAFLTYKSFAKPPVVADIKTPPPAALYNDNTDETPPVNTPPAETAPDEEANSRKEGVYTFLLVGFDQNNGNTDTLMVGRFDSKNHKINIASIPRDTCANVYFGRKAQKKINAVYALGGGIEALMAAVADMTGFNIDNYIVVNLKAFTALVDALGGVYFDIPHDMNYDDPTQDLHIHFNKGFQYLSGADAIKVVRWRQNNDGTNYGDIDRINTQQSFLKTVAKQCLSLTNIVTKTDDYLEIFKSYVKTDLSAQNLTWYAQEFLKLKTEDISFHTLPSNPIDSIKGFSYGTIYLDEWLKLINDCLNPYTKAVAAEDVNIITRDEGGRLYATSGEIAGGDDSFLDYNEWYSAYKASAEAQEDAETGTAAEDVTESGGAAGTENIADDAGLSEVITEVTGSGGDTAEETAEGSGLFYTGGDISEDE